MLYYLSSIIIYDHLRCALVHNEWNQAVFSGPDRHRTAGCVSSSRPVVPEKPPLVDRLLGGGTGDEFLQPYRRRMTGESNRCCKKIFVDQLHKLESYFSWFFVSWLFISFFRLFTAGQCCRKHVGLQPSNKCLKNSATLCSKGSTLRSVKKVVYISTVACCRYSFYRKEFCWTQRDFLQACCRDGQLHVDFLLWKDFVRRVHKACFCCKNPLHLTAKLGLRWCVAALVAQGVELNGKNMNTWWRIHTAWVCRELPN